MHKDWSYILNITQPENICYGGVLKDYLNNESNSDVVVDYSRCAYLKFSLNNINCNNSSDSITYSRLWLTNNESQGENTYVGCDYFEGDFFDLPAGNYQYTWEVTRNGTTTYHDESFFFRTRR